MNGVEKAAVVEAPATHPDFPQQLAHDVQGRDPGRHGERRRRESLTCRKNPNLRQRFR